MLWVLKVKDWIWIVKYDNPLVSDSRTLIRMNSRAIFRKATTTHFSGARCRLDGNHKQRHHGQSESKANFDHHGQRRTLLQQTKKDIAPEQHDTFYEYCWRWVTGVDNNPPFCNRVNYSTTRFRVIKPPEKYCATVANVHSKFPCVLEYRTCEAFNSAWEK